MSNKSGQYKSGVKQKAFLAAFAECGNISRAALIADIHRGQHYEWMQNEDYARAFKAAYDEACDSLEMEARRRAVEGLDKPVFQGGQCVGVIREYSDTLLIFLMKGAMPQKYRENIKAEVTGADGGPIQNTLTVRFVDGE